LHVKEGKLISLDKWNELVRDGKDYMSVGHVKHVSFYFLGPSDSIAPAASRTEAVFTIVIYFSSIATLWTGVNVYTQSSRSARPDCLNSFVLLGLNKMFGILAVNVPPSVKEMSKTILFLAKPVMLFLSCMNSTFTHAAIVFEPILANHTLDKNLNANANLHLFS
jgi:hypothetical protein